MARNCCRAAVDFPDAGGPNKTLFKLYFTARLPQLASQRANRRANHGDLIAAGHNLEHIIQQRTHLHHLLNAAVEEAEVHELRVRSGDVELAGPFQVNAGGCGRGLL